MLKVLKKMLFPKAFKATTELHLVRQLHLVTAKEETLFLCPRQQIAVFPLSFKVTSPAS